jgi:hypothetical protein
MKTMIPSDKDLKNNDILKYELKKDENKKNKRQAIKQT